VHISKAGWATDLVSAKLEGMSTVMAPPKRGVFVNDIFADQGMELGIMEGVAGVDTIDVACCSWFICLRCEVLVMV
jgi:hypothetical protein